MEAEKKTSHMNVLSDTHIMYNPCLDEKMDCDYWLEFFRYRSKYQFWVLFQEDGVHSKQSRGNYQKTVQQIGKAVAKLSVLRTKVSVASSYTNCDFKS